MDLLDAAVAIAAVSAAVGGYRLGFLARAVSWIGLALGLALSARLLPRVVAAFRDTTPTGKLLVAALVLLAGAFLGQALGLVVGSRIHRFIPIGPLRGVDNAVGAAVGFTGVLVAVWLLLPSMADVPGWPARQARNSAIGREVNRQLPPPPNTLETLRKLVGNQAFPQVFNALSPAVDSGPAPVSSGLPASVEASVRRSTVKVRGTACQRIQEGSGWAVAPDLVLTNAHVVAGERRPEVLTPTARVLPATVVAFDANRDLALLRVIGLGESPLALLRTPSTAGAQDKLMGTVGAVFGHPGGTDPIASTPFLIRRYVSALGRDLYGQHDTKRDVFIMAADIMPGDSGGPLVNAAGTVVGVAFAIAPDRPGTSYALSYTEVAAFLAAPPAASTGASATGSAAGSAAAAAVSTGPCVTD